MFTELDFNKRLRMAVSEAWNIFQNKVGNKLIDISKEASMQLHYAYILQNIVPLIIFNKDEEIHIELENTVYLKNKTTCEIDLLLVGKKNNKIHKIAVEMKCYKEFAASGGKRGATDIFMKDVYVDLEKLETYFYEEICQNKVFLLMTDLDRLVFPKNKDAKCWDYDISDGYKLTPKKINTPIGGKEQLINIKENYIFKWTKNGKYYFLEL